MNKFEFDMNCDFKRIYTVDFNIKQLWLVKKVVLYILLVLPNEYNRMFYVNSWLVWFLIVQTVLFHLFINLFDCVVLCSFKI